MSYLDILNETRQNMATANPFENMIRGAQGFNQIQNQLFQNQAAQQTLEQNAAMNPLLMQSRQAQLQGQQAQNQAAQMEIDDFQKKERLGQLYRASQALKPFIEKGDLQGASTVAAKLTDFGLPQETAAEVQRLVQIGDADTIRGHINTIESLAGSMMQDQETMTEYQRRSLEIREKELNQPTVNEKNLNRYQELKKTDPEAARMFGQEVGLLPPDKKLSAGAEKTLTDSTQNYYDLTKQAREYGLLADDFQRFANELPAGAAATVSEFFKAYTGSQDEATNLRTRLNRVRLSEGLKYLPPGPATDRDVEEAYKGVPKETASPEQVQMFLRGAAKMAAIDADFEEFKSNYISQFNSVQGLIPAWKAEIAQGRVQSINDLQPKKDEAPRAKETADDPKKRLEELRRKAGL